MLRFIWDHESGQNVEHIADNFLTVGDVEYVVENFYDEDVSQSTGRPIRFDFLSDGTHVAVVFTWIDEVTIEPITAFRLPR